jgi:hypothetical protein
LPLRSQFLILIDALSHPDCRAILDGGNPDDKKKIRQAQDIMTGYVELLMGQADTNTKHLDELGKHAKAISKFTSD